MVARKPAKLIQANNRHSPYKPLEPSQGSQIRPIRDYWGLLGLLMPSWEDLAPLV